MMIIDSISLYVATNSRCVFRKRVEPVASWELKWELGKVKRKKTESNSPSHSDILDFGLFPCFFPRILFFSIPEPLVSELLRVQTQSLRLQPKNLYDLLS